MNTVMRHIITTRAGQNRPVYHCLLWAALLVVLFTARWSEAEVIGSVDTKFNLLTPDHKIVIEAFDDPKVEGVACHLSRAQKGGLKGALGVAEDPSDASIACRQVGPVKITERLEEGELVFKKKTSLIFKKMSVVRFFDKKRNTLVYLVYSDKLIEGSPKNSISTVPIMPWSGAAAREAR